jgi:quinol monooxygenase YgiN
MSAAPSLTKDQLNHSQTGVVVINVFRVGPEDQEQLIDLLTQATERFVKNAAGFLSATLHRSTDGSKVVMYARWRSARDYQAMREDLAPRPFLERALTFATFDPGIYVVAREFGPQGLA